MKVPFLSLLLSFFLIVPVAFAQQLDEGDFLLDITPENPQPNQKITATIQSYSTDINNVLISWMYGGVALGGGIGKRTIEVQVGELGERKTLEAAIYVTSTSVIRKSAVIAPGNSELLWESLDAHVPPFYKGKPLVPSEGMVRVSAFPERATTARKLTYIWSKNGTVAESASGYGKIGFLFKNNYLNPVDTIEATIRRADNTVSNDLVTVSTVRPSFVFYHNTAGFTDYATTITGSYAMQNDFETFVAEPLYFSALKPLEQILNITWTLGGQGASSGDRINEIVISRGENKGSTQVGVSGKNQNLLTQFSENNFLLNF